MSLVSFLKNLESMFCSALLILLNIFFLTFKFCFSIKSKASSKSLVSNLFTIQVYNKIVEQLNNTKSFVKCKLLMLIWLKMFANGLHMACGDQINTKFFFNRKVRK